MKRYFLLLCSCVFCSAILFSCKENTTTSSTTTSDTTSGDKKSAEVSRNVTSFTAVAIDVPLSATITVKEGAQSSIQLSGNESLLLHIKTEVKDGALSISSKDDWNFHSDENIKANIIVPSLTALNISGDATTVLQGNITGPKFALDISGSGDITIDNINVTDFSTDISGAGKIVIKGGNVAHANYSVNGAGNIAAFPLQTTETVAEVSGAGLTEVSAQHKLEAHINGTGSIRYKGHPELVSDVSGVGTVTDAN